MPNDMFLRIGHLIPIGSSDIKGDDQKSRYAKGQISLVYDAFGPRTFRYLRNATGGAILAGELISRAAAVTITDATSGTTTSVKKTGAGWTVDAFLDRLLLVTDNADAAGAAPEGEAGVIVDNDAENILVDGQRPFTAAIANLDDLSIYSLFDSKDAADGDLASNVFGVPMADLTDKNWGWFQCFGYCPDVRYETNAVVLGDPVVAAAASLGPFGTDPAELWVGYSPNGIASDQVTPFKAVAFINVYHHMIGNGAA